MPRRLRAVYAMAADMAQSVCTNKTDAGATAVASHAMPLKHCDWSVKLRDMRQHLKLLDRPLHLAR
jgi:hypothetical protein